MKTTQLTRNMNIRLIEHMHQSNQSNDDDEKQKQKTCEVVYDFYLDL